jgi:hypothetical protein
MKNDKLILKDWDNPSKLILKFIFYKYKSISKRHIKSYIYRTKYHLTYKEIGKKFNVGQEAIRRDLNMINRLIEKNR